MSFLLGSTKERRNVSGPTAGAHDQLINWITSQGFDGLNPGTNPDPATIEPFQKLFRDQNAQNFAQVKESAGNLTGSGFGNYLGLAAQRASTEQGSFLAEFLERRRQADANRYLQAVLGAFGSPAAGVQYTHQPGLLDYAVEGASAAAPFFLGGGGSPSMRGVPVGGSNIVEGEWSGPRGQLGQASIYRFLSPAAPNWRGTNPAYDAFGTPRTDEPRIPIGRLMP